MRALLFFGTLMILATPALAEVLGVPYRPLPRDFFTRPDPLAETWHTVPPVTVPLLPQNIAAPGIAQASIATVEVRAVHNDQWVAFLLVWQDATHNTAISHDHFSDACAIQLPLKSTATSPFMGNAGMPVAILHWKAIWQQDIDDHYQTVKDLYPNTWQDTDRFGASVAIDAGNPVARPARTVPVEELVAAGFGTLTTQARQNAQGRGFWKDGRWHVVFTRPLQSQDTQDPRLRAGHETVAAFAVWEGGSRNIGGRKHYAPWIALQLEKKP